MTPACPDFANPARPLQTLLPFITPAWLYNTCLPREHLPALANPADFSNPARPVQTLLAFVTPARLDTTCLPGQTLPAFASPAGF